MKKILFAMILLAATWQVSLAQSVTRAACTAKVNLMDTYIGSSDLTNANATFDLIQQMMKQALHDNKGNVATAPDPTTKSAYMSTIQNQGVLFNQIWKLKNDLATNRAAIRSKLETFELTLD